MSVFLLDRMLWHYMTYEVWYAVRYRNQISKTTSTNWIPAISWFHSFTIVWDFNHEYAILMPFKQNYLTKRSNPGRYLYTVSVDMLVKAMKDSFTHHRIHFSTIHLSLVWSWCLLQVEDAVSVSKAILCPEEYNDTTLISCQTPFWLTASNKIKIMGYRQDL